MEDATRPKQMEGTQSDVSGDSQRNGESMGDDMRHLLISTCHRAGDQLTFTHAAACGAEARCLCTDVRLVNCPDCLKISVD